MYYINHFDSFSTHSNIYAKKILKPTCQDFEQVTPMKRDSIAKLHDHEGFTEF